MSNDKGQQTLAVSPGNGKTIIEFRCLALRQFRVFQLSFWSSKSHLISIACSRKIFLLDAFKKSSAKGLDPKEPTQKGQNQWKILTRKPARHADIGMSWLTNEVNAGNFRRRSAADPRGYGMRISPKRAGTCGVAAFSVEKKLKKSSKSGLPGTLRGENPHD